jgi:hypothetical protein
MKTLLNLSLLILLLPSYLSAQRSLDLGVFLGVSSYLGDFAPDIPALRQVHEAIGISGRYFFQPKLSVKVQGIYSHLSGDDADTRNASRGWQFRSPIIEGMAQIEIHPFAHARRNYGFLDHKQFTSYFFTGVGFVYSNPTITKPDAPVAKSTDAPTGRVMITLPIGAGLRYEYGKRMLFTGELGIRTPLTDHLDGASLTPNHINHDWYLLGGVTIAYLLFAEN